jgi:hypothetical protein
VHATLDPQRTPFLDLGRQRAAAEQLEGNVGQLAVVWGFFRRITSPDSRSKRTASVVSMWRSCMTFTATRLPSDICSASYTTP